MSSGIPNAFSAMHQDHSGSLRFLDASFSARAVRSDPAAVSSHLALDGDLPRASLCLRLTHVVTSMSPRLDSRWGGSFPLPGREFHPLEASGLA